MNAGIAAYVILTQNTEVTDIVGVNIFPEVAEQETATPFIVYQLQSVAPEDTHDGPSKLDEVRFEFLCYADTYALAADLGDKVRGALDRVSGTYNGVNVESVQFNDVDIDTIDAPRRFAQVLTFTFRIKRDDFEIAQGTPVTGAMLGDLYDVDTTGVSDGQVIAYDADAQEWQPADGGGGVTELGQLDDVQFSQDGPEDGNVLFYDGDTWTNDTLQKSQIGLGNVDNTSDADKPVSSATQTALGAKANSADFSNVDNTSDADKPVSTATQTALNAKADTSAVPTDLNDLSDVSIVGTPEGNQALIYDTTAGAFKSQVSYTNRFEDEVETGLQIPTIFAERGYSVKAEGDGIFVDAESDTPTAGKVIKRKIYHKTGFISEDDVIGDYTLIHTFADDTAYADTVAVFDAFEDGATYGVPPFTLVQSWEEEDAAPSFVGLLNETYGSGAEAAYSTRRLNGNVTECMVIRRASDSTTTTIGFEGSGNIDESAITTFCTGTTCTVSEWKDQSGNGNHATQSTAGNQPTIYTGGAIVKENGRVALDFDGSNDNMTSVSTYVPTSSMAQILVVKGLSSSTDQIIGDTADRKAGMALRIQNGNFNYFNGITSTFNQLTHTANDFQNLHFYGRDTSSTFYARLNGGETSTAISAINTTAQNIYLAARHDGSLDLDGTIQEYILYLTSKSAVESDIEENVGDYFTQNTPLLDTYTGAAAAYSLRKLRTAYTGDAVEVYNGSSYADIGFNVFGELDTVALADHCGSNNGFIRTWYDQAGSNDATQSTTSQMPKIYDGTNGVVLENGKPAVEFDGTDDALSSGSVDVATMTISSVHTLDSTDGQKRPWAVKGAVNGAKDTFGQASDLTLRYDGAYSPNTITPLTGTQYLRFSVRSTSAQTDFVNGTSNINDTQTLPNIEGTYSIGNAISLTVTFEGRIQEAIAWESDKSSDRTGIESNTNTFYDIY